MDADINEASKQRQHIKHRCEHAKIGANLPGYQPIDRETGLTWYDDVGRYGTMLDDILQGPSISGALAAYQASVA